MSSNPVYSPEVVQCRRNLKSANIQTYLPCIEKVEKGMKAAGNVSSTCNAYTNKLCTFAGWCVAYHNSVSFTDVEVDDVREYVNFLRDSLHLAPNTINIYLASVRKMFQFLRNTELSKRELPDLIVDIKLPRVPAVQQVTAMISACADTLARLLVILLISTGMRISEAANLRFCDIDRHSRQILIPKSKGHIERMVPLSQSSIDALERYCNEYNENHPQERLKKDDYVFLQPNQPARPMTSAKLRKIFIEVQECAGLSDYRYRCHSCRHYFALQYYLQSHDALLIMQLLGHKTLKATEVYLRLASAIEVQQQYVNPGDMASQNI